MIDGEGIFHHLRDVGKYPDDREDWESGDYERFYGGLEDEDLEPLLSDEVEIDYSKIDVSRYLEQSVSKPAEARTYRWHYDNAGYYAYILFDGDTRLCDEVVGKLKARGIVSMAIGRSHKPADNGGKYDWYLRVAEMLDGKARRPRRHVVAGAFRQMPILEPDDSEENLELLRLIQQLENDLEEERTLSDGLYMQLVEGQERMADLLQRVKTLNSELRGLREDRQTLASRLDRQGQETDEAREKANELSDTLSEKDRELQKKEGELDTLFFEASKVEEHANLLHGRLQESKERLTEAEREIDELRRQPDPELGTSGSSRRSSRRVEDVLGKVLDDLLPNLRFLNRRSVSTLVKELNSPTGALKLLKELNSSPGSLRSRPFRRAPGWREEHYNTGADDLGRIYYRDAGESGPHKYVVHVSLKDSQKADEKLLKQYS